MSLLSGYGEKLFCSRSAYCIASPKMSRLFGLGENAAMYPSLRGARDNHPFLRLAGVLQDSFRELAERDISKANSIFNCLDPRVTPDGRVAFHPLSLAFCSITGRTIVQYPGDTNVGNDFGSYVNAIGMHTCDDRNRGYGVYFILLCNSFAAQLATRAGAKKLAKKDDMMPMADTFGLLALCPGYSNRMYFGSSPKLLMACRGERLWNLIGFLTEGTGASLFVNPGIPSGKSVSAVWDTEEKLGWGQIGAEIIPLREQPSVVYY